MKNNIRTFRPALLAVALYSAFAASAQSLPAGGQAIAGQAAIATQGNRMLVTTTNAAGARHSAINWQSFSVGAGHGAFFQQPDAGSTSINRVLGSNPSQIFGTLGSNGHLVLVNPSGIAVGAGAVVDTARFTASTLGMSDADALAGRLRFQGDAASGPLSVQGQVLARGGDVVLLAPNVEAGAQAAVQAEGGAVILGAGRKVEITGRGLEGIHFEVQAPQDKAVNLGTLKGDAVGMFAGTLRHSGAIRAQTATLQGGRVVLLGDDVKVGAGATVDASGAQGGGTILVGGDFQGRNPGVKNAKNTEVGAGAVLAADAGSDGDGGKVIVWADGTTRFEGHVSARGGAEGGNGGFAEVSGKQLLEFRGTADLRAPKGQHGKLLLDPARIIVGTAANIDQTPPGGDDIVTATDLDSATGDYPGMTSFITANALAGLLDTTDVSLAAVDLIRIAAPVNKVGAPATTLTMDATSIRIDSDIGSTGGPLNLQLNPGVVAVFNTAKYTNGTLNVSNGKLRLNGSAGFDNVTLGSSLDLSGPGDLSIYNTLTLADGITLKTGLPPMLIRGNATIATLGAATVQQQGNFVFLNWDDDGGVLTIGPGVTWSGMGGLFSPFAGGGMVNQGVIHANVANQLLFVGPDNLDNQGELRVSDGYLVLEPVSWTNTGTMNVSGGEFIIAAPTTLSMLSGNITRTGGSIRLGHALDLEGGTLDIGSGGIFGTGGLTSMEFGGELMYGTVVSNDGTPLRSVFGGLRAMTLGSNITMGRGDTVVFEGLTLADGTTLTLSDGTGAHILAFEGSQTVGAAGAGAADVVSAGGSVWFNCGCAGPETLTIGSGITWAGYTGFREAGPDGTFVNNGTILATVPGKAMAIQASNVVNNGLVQAVGGDVRVAGYGNVTNATTGTIANTGAGTLLLPKVANDGAIVLTDGTTTLGGDFTLSSFTSGVSRTGGTLNFRGRMDLEGGTLDIGSGGAFGTGGLSLLDRGQFRNGTLVSGDATPLNSNSGLLRTMTIGSNLALDDAGTTRIVGGLVLNNGVVLDAGSHTLQFVGTQSIATTGSAEIVLDGGTMSYNLAGTGQSLSLGPNVTLTGTGTIRDEFYMVGAPQRGMFASHGIVAPGTGAATGTLTFYGDLTLDNQFGGLAFGLISVSSYDKVVVIDGTVSWGADTTFLRTDLPGASYTSGDVFDLIESGGVMGGVIAGPIPVFTGFTTTITPAPEPVFLRLTAD